MLTLSWKRSARKEIGMIHIDIDPVAFTIGTHAVRWYGIMVALAVATLVV